MIDDAICKSVGMPLNILVSFMYHATKAMAELAATAKGSILFNAFWSSDPATAAKLETS